MNKSASIAVPSRLAITYRPLSDLVPDPRNARTHPKRQIDQIRESIKAFGFTNPILADPEGNIIAGHGRLQAARLMGIAEVPVITLSGLSETQKRTLRIADNKIALNAGWDLEILQQEFGELASLNPADGSVIARVRMAGRALTDGLINQRVRVQNLSSGRIVEGIARSEQVVEIILQ